MKIAFVTGVLEATGGDHILFKHASGLRKMGHEVVLFCNGVMDALIEIKKDFFDSHFPISIYRSPDELRRMTESGFDAVVANGIFGATMALGLPHPNKIWLCQNFDPYYVVDGTPTAPADDILRAYGGTTKFLVYSKTLAQIIEKHYGPKKFEICTNGVEAKDMRAYRKTGLKGSKRICFCSAYFRTLKGSKLASETFAMLRRMGYETVCIVATPQYLAGTSELHINPPNAKKYAVVAGCDVSIHPSIFETWCLSVMESMALGTPVVGTDSLGIREYANEQNLVFVRDRNPQSMCDAISSLLSDEARYLDIQARGASTADKYDWDDIMGSIEKSYERIVAA